MEKDGNAGARKNVMSPSQDFFVFFFFDRSKYRTLLRELAVNNHAATVFNNNTTPHNLRRAITMYIDYLTEMNESHVKVAEFNTAPLMEPGFDYEEYYHEVSFLLESFKNLL